MARRRMFTAELIESDRFTELPVQVQMLYVYMSVHADDEGFVSSGKRMAQLYGGVEGLEQLEGSDFIIRFPSGVLVIVDWHLNNTIRKDRSSPTIHRTEREQVMVLNGRYVRCDNQTADTCQPDDNQVTTKCQPNDNQLTTRCQPNDNQLTTICQPFDNHLATQNRTEENITDKTIIDQNIAEQPAAADGWGGVGWDTPDTVKTEKDQPAAAPAFTEICHYCTEAGLEKVNVLDFWKHYTLCGWCDRQGRPLKNWKAAIKAWDASQRAP